MIVNARQSEATIRACGPHEFVSSSMATSESFRPPQGLVCLAFKSQCLLKQDSAYSNDRERSSERSDD